MKPLRYQNKENGLGFYINEILGKEGQSLLSNDEIFEIGKFDDAVLIIDDLFDKSKTRNGAECFYIKHGEQETHRAANQLFSEAKEALSNVAETRSLNEDTIKKIISSLERLQTDINAAQQIDSELQNTAAVDDSLIEKYRKMVTLFTGNHIKTAYEIGYLLANKKPDQKMLEEGINLGILRQIEDDIADYSHSHHEPLNDLKSHNKRLPEILFYLHAAKSDIDQVEKELKQEKPDTEKIRTLVLNPEVMRLIEQEKQRYKF